MEEPRLVCVFKDILKSCSNGNKAFFSKPLTDKQVTKIQTSSGKRGDKFYKEKLCSKNVEFNYHTSCYASYTSQDKIEKYVKSVKSATLNSPVSSPPPKRLRSSDERLFEFKKACLFCGKDCSIVRDSKHPDRWEKNPGVLCKTANRGKDQFGNERKSFKEVLLETCDNRKDILGDQVRVRLEGAVSDLHAADARYHKSCYVDFVNVRSIKAAQNQFDQVSPDKEPFNFVLRSIRNEPDKIWNSIELINAYKNKGGSEINTSRFVTRIKEYLKDEVYCFKAPGVATVIIHQGKAAEVLKLVGNTDEDEDVDINKVAKQIKSEINEKPGIKEKYPVLDSDELSDICLPTLKTVLETVSPKFRSNHKVVALISGMITTIATSRTSILQIALGLFVKEKKIMDYLYEYGITSTYDEVRRFKVSAAHFAKKETMVLDSKNGLIQGVSDNFDCNLSTQNGLKQTHSLATIVVQHNNSSCKVTREAIPRLKKSEVSSVNLKGISLKIHVGEKKPAMPDSSRKVGVLSLNVLCNQAITVQRSRYNDFQYLKDTAICPNTPDFGGYNTKRTREAGQSKNLKSSIIYKPLINKTPSDPSTILTAMCDIEKVSHQSGQEVTIFTCDQQLYRVTMDVIWSNPARWKDFYPRLGGMHWLMSFSGAVGKLMKNSGLDKLMKSSFAGVDKMLVGKKFPMNIRALRIVAVELLRIFIDENTTYDNLTKVLRELSAKSRLAEHWIKNLVYPVFLMLMYVRAEREGEFGLHLYVCKKMIPYFFAAGHWNYARDGTVYIRMMENLPDSVLNKFMKGQHVVHLQEGFWNGIWSDMAIESTYMKIGKGPSGIVGITTNDRSVSIWANSHHLCSELLTELSDLGNKQQTSHDKHKEEGAGRIDSDNIDRNKIRSTLEKCIHPLDLETHACNKLVNIYSGEESEDSVNVNKAIDIGSKQFKEFQESLPDGFRKPLSSKVVTMTSRKDKKKKKNDYKTEFNTDILFSRVLYLLGTNQIDLAEVFNYELAPVPTSLFYDSGDARYSTAKNVLMNKLKVEESSRGIHPDAIVIDGGGMLHSKIHWPTNGLVRDLVDGIEKYLRKIINTSDVYLIFDRYYEGSIKSDTRLIRVGAFRRSHQLTMAMDLPPKDMCMSSIQTKECLIELIAETLFQKFIDEISDKRLIITSKSKTPEEINHGVRIKRHDLVSYYDEADYLIPQQVDSIVREGKKVIKIVSADTDVFVLLCSLFNPNMWSSSNVYMDNFIEGTKMININKSVERNIDLMPSLIALHALSGCDYIPQMFGIGKGKSLKACNEVPLRCIGDLDANIDDVIMEGKTFTAKCFGQKNISSSVNRCVIWKNKTDGAKLSAKPPMLRSLPPTDAALELNIKRAHFAATMWKNCISGRPPQMDPCQFGWEMDEDQQILLPTMLPNGTKIAPETVLKITKCKCSSTHCITNQCSCFKATISCSEYCSCEESNCDNRNDIANELSDEGTDEEEEYLEDMDVEH